MEILPDCSTGMRRAASPGLAPGRTSPVSVTQPMVAPRAAGLTTYGPPTSLSAACIVARAQKARSTREWVMKGILAAFTGARAPISPSDLVDHVRTADQLVGSLHRCQGTEGEEHTRVGHERHSSRIHRRPCSYFPFRRKVRPTTAVSGYPGVP